MRRGTGPAQAGCGATRTMRPRASASPPIASVFASCLVKHRPLRAAALLLCAMLLAVTLSAISSAPAMAQDPSLESSLVHGGKKKKKGTTSPAAFPGKSGDMFGKIKPPDKTQPLYLQGARLTYLSAIK